MLTTALATAQAPILLGQPTTLSANGQAFSLLALSTLSPAPTLLTGVRLSAVAMVAPNGFPIPTNSIDFIFR